jgi:hypothetical protein
VPLPETSNFNRSKGLNRATTRRHVAPHKYLSIKTQTKFSTRARRSFGWMGLANTVKS